MATEAISVINHIRVNSPLPWGCRSSLVAGLAVLSTGSGGNKVGMDGSVSEEENPAAEGGAGVAARLAAAVRV